MPVEEKKTVWNKVKTQVISIVFLSQNAFKWSLYKVVKSLDGIALTVKYNIYVEDSRTAKLLLLSNVFRGKISYKYLNIP